MAELLAQRDVAQRLGVAESTVSRYLKRYPELRDDAGLVDFEGFSAHYARNSRTKPNAAPERALSRLDAREKVNENRAALLEMELAERKGTLKPAALIARVVEEATAALFGAVERGLEEALTGAEDTTEARVAAIEALIREARAAHAARMQELAATHDAGGTERP